MCILCIVFISDKFYTNKSIISKLNRFLNVLLAVCRHLVFAVKTPTLTLRQIISKNKCILNN